MEETVVGPRETFCEDVIPLSSMDQHALRIYSQGVIVFKTEPNQDIYNIIQHLKNGLQGALSEIPDFAGRIVPKPGSTRQELDLILGPDSGAPFKTVDHSSSSCTGDSLDWCHELLRGRTFADLEKENFPLTKLPEKVLLMPHATSEDDCPEGVPGLLVQANIIDGGLLLGFAWHHTVSDGRGADNFLGAWAKATNLSYNDGNTDLPDNPTEQVGDRWRLSYGNFRSYPCRLSRICHRCFRTFTKVGQAASDRPPIPRGSRLRHLHVAASPGSNTVSPLTMSIVTRGKGPNDNSHRLKFSLPCCGSTSVLRGGLTWPFPAAPRSSRPASTFAVG